MIGYADTITGVLRAEYGPLRHAAKHLAALTGASVRSAENWLAGVCAPQGDHLLILRVAVPRLREALDARAEALAQANDGWMGRQAALAEGMRFRGVS